MYCMMYFDVEDYLSPPDSPAHFVPGRMAEIMTEHGLPGSFHIMGEKVRFLERNRLTRVIDAIRKHDVCLHYDRGSMHPTTAEEVSRLDWFEGVDRVIFRELPGFQTIERVFGKCSGLTQHGATFAAQIVYAAGKMGKPFFASPFHLAGRNVVWFCNNLLIATGEGGNFDREYRDTPAFEKKLAAQADHLRARMGKVDLVPLFGCHPLITVMEEFPCAVNFLRGARPPRDQWKAPRLIPGVPVERVLANFERRVKSLADFPGLQWTTTGGIAKLYGRRPARVGDAAVLDGARAVVENGGPTFTNLLSAGELLFLLARRKLAQAAVYEVPQIMGPVRPVPGALGALPAAIDLRAVSAEIAGAAYASGYLPEALSPAAGRVSAEAALLLLSCDAIGVAPSAVAEPRLTVEAIPGVAEALKEVNRLKDWRIHAPDFGQENITRHFRWQTWTLKPAFRPEEYPVDVETGVHLNPALPFANVS